MKKRLYYIRKEVIATSLEKALKGKGRLLEVILADEKMWPQEAQPKCGFEEKVAVDKKGKKGGLLSKIAGI